MDTRCGLPPSNEGAQALYVGGPVGTCPKLPDFEGWCNSCLRWTIDIEGPHRSCECGRPAMKLACRCTCEKCNCRVLWWVPVGHYLDKDLVCQGCGHIQDTWDC